MTFTSCAGNNIQYTLTSEGQVYQQATDVQIDILWVVDNSASMDRLQSNLTSNFSNFILQFMQKEYDFRIAVTTSEAYLADPQFRNNSLLSEFKQNGPGETPSGFPIITRETPDILNVFLKNSTQGAGGSGDERAFSSFRSTLENSQNRNFPRPGAFLAIVILSDEDDFSNPSRPELRGDDKDYSQVGLEPISTYVNYLKLRTNFDGTKMNFNVSAISILDKACHEEHLPFAPSSSIGQRYIELVRETNGVLGSICDASFATSLQRIASRISELSTQFSLDRRPRVDTILVTVDGVGVPRGDVNGWSYVEKTNTVRFHGTHIPKRGANITISYTPATSR